MAAKRSANQQKSSGKKAVNRQIEPQAPLWVRALLALTLVPLVGGVILIAAWALDLLVWGPGQAQIVVGSLFILLSFAASNALQKKWILAAGWTLLLLADWLLWTFTTPWIQVVSFIIGGLGLLALGYEFFLRIQAQGSQKNA